MGITRGAITKFADRLLAKGLAAREATPDDGWSHRILPTARGADLVPELAALADANDAACFAHLSDRDRSAMLRILQATVRRLGLTAIPID